MSGWYTYVCAFLGLFMHFWRDVLPLNLPPTAGRYLRDVHLARRDPPCQAERPATWASEFVEMFSLCCGVLSTLSRSCHPHRHTELSYSDSSNPFQ